MPGRKRGLITKGLQPAIAIALALTAHAPLGAQALPPGTVLVASEGTGGGDTLFPAMLAGMHETRGMNPALSQSLKAAEEAAPTKPAPLTTKGRLTLFWNETYASPGLWAGVAGGAMVDQVRHTPLKWDGDGNGYTRRFASEYGQLAVRNSIYHGMAGLTGVDPRYTVCKCQGTLRRGTHALLSTFITYREDGRPSLNMPSIASGYGAGMISTFWYPHQQFNPLVQGVQFGHEQMGELVVNNLLQEFGPDVQRRLHIKALTARRAAKSGDDD
jgi:hypothetical protein